jgi:nitric oxide reductase NorQ protein
MSSIDKSKQSGEKKPEENMSHKETVQQKKTIVDEFLGIGKKNGKQLSPKLKAKRAKFLQSFVAFCKDQGISFGGKLNTKSGELKEINILPVDSLDFMRSKVPKYREQKNEFKILKAHAAIAKPTLFVGPAGIGKTLLLDAFASMENLPLVRFDCSEGAKRTDLIGRFVLIGDETVFQLGVLPMAIEIANQTGFAMLVLEELNALTPAMQKVLNQLLDYRGLVYVDGVQKVYQLRNGAKLLICGSMNPSTYGGVHELNEDLMSRFAVIKCNYPTPIKEKAILDCDGIPEEVVENILTLAKETRALVTKGEIDYAISPRDTNAFCQLLKAYMSIFDIGEAVELALENAIVGKYEQDSHMQTIRARIKSTFGSLNTRPTSS